MKLNEECMKSVLLEFESFGFDYITEKSFKKSIEKYGFDDVLYSLVKLTDECYINASYERTQDGVPHFGEIQDITIKGHQFLEQIKSDNN